MNKKPSFVDANFPHSLNFGGTFQCIAAKKEENNKEKYKVKKFSFLNTKNKREEQLVIQIPNDLENQELEPPQVIWYYGSEESKQIYRNFKFNNHQNPKKPSIPIDVCLCSFGTNDFMLCILIDFTKIEIYSENGKTYSVSLPCKVYKIWGVNYEFLILERNPFSIVQNSETITPMFFTLTHPLEEIRPMPLIHVAITNNKIINNNTLIKDNEDDLLMNETIEHSELLNNDNDSIVFIYKDLFLVIYNKETKQLSMFIMEKNSDRKMEYEIPEESPLQYIDVDCYLHRVSFYNNEDYSKFLQTESKNDLRISILPLNGLNNQFILFILKSDKTLIAFKIVKNETSEIPGYVLVPLFTKSNVLSIAEFNYLSANEKLFNNLSNNCLHFLLIKEQLYDLLLLVLNGEFIMWEQQLPSNKFLSIEQVVENKFTLKSIDNINYRYMLDIVPNSKLVADCFSVLYAVFPQAIYSSIFFDFQQQFLILQQPHNEWKLFCSLISYLIFGSSKNSNIIDFNSMDSWELMEYLENNQGLNSASIDFTKIRTNRNNFISLLPLFVFSLHLLYETYKLSLYETKLLYDLGSFIFELAHSIQWTSYLDYYQCDFNFNLKVNQNVLIPNDLTKTITNFNQNLRHINELYCTGLLVPNIHQWIEESLSVSPISPFPIILNCCATELTRKICRFFDLLTSKSLPLEDLYNPNSQIPSNEMIIDGSLIDIHPTSDSFSELPPHERVALAILQEGYESLSDFEFLPFGIYLPLREALLSCRNTNQPVTRTLQYCKLIEREDLSMNYQLTDIPEDHPSSDKHIVNEILKQANMIAGNKSDESEEGLQEEEFDIGHMIWSEDRRLNQVRKMLDPSIPILIQKQTLQLSDDDLDGFDPNEAPELQRRLLLNVYQQVLSLCVGKGMIDLSTKNHVHANNLSLDNEASGQLVTIPPISLTAKLKRNRAMVSIDMSKILYSKENEVSSNGTWTEFHNGVASGLSLSGKCQVTREWIMFHKPKRLGQRQSSESIGHAGFLLALGLQGHLKCLISTDIYGYLQQRHEATTIGILLGLSCSYIGTQDQYVTRTLSLYIPSLMVGTNDIEIPMEVSSVAVLGIGLLYMKSGNRFVTEILLGELARPPNDNSASTRESYSLAAGLGLGLVHLGKGSNNGNTADLKMDQRLLAYMLGGKRPEFDSFAILSKSKQKLPKGQLFDASSCTKIKESEKFVNVDVTGAGACLALTLKYLKTHDENIYNEIQIPNSKYLLDYVRPDMITLRVLGSSLIMWNDIKNTEDWIKSKIPTLFLTSNPEQFIENEDMTKTYASAVSGCCLAIGLRYAGSHDQNTFQLLMDIIKQLQKSRLKLYRNTPKKQQTSYLIEPTLYFKLDKITMENTITVCLLAVCCVMAGSGNVEIIRLVRQLRYKVVSSPNTLYGGYGQQMALSMALGLLFLGGGRCSLSTSDQSIASLLCALYPIFPQTTTDNKYHCQAFRHLFALAVENRLIETIDIDTKETCFVPIKIETLDGQIIQKLSPCLIPEFHLIKEIKIEQNERYYPLTLSEFPLKTQIIFVKKKSGYLTYKEDPKGVRSSLQCSFVSKMGNTESTIDLFKKMTNDSNIGAYMKFKIFNNSQYLPSLNQQILNKEIQRNDKVFHSHESYLFYNSLINALLIDCPDSLYLFEKLMKGLQTITNNNMDIGDSIAKVIYISSFKQLFTYYNNRNLITNSKSIIPRHTIESMKNYLSKYFESFEMNWKEMLSNGNSSLFNKKDFGSYCCFYSLPYLHLLRACLLKGTDELKIACSNLPNNHFYQLINSKFLI